MSGAYGFNPGDVDIDQALISGPPGTVDFGRRIHTIDVFENITKPYTSVQVVVVDASDMLNYNLGLDGKNGLRLVFGQPGQDPYVWQGTATSITKNRDLSSQRVAVYNMVGYSRHMLNLQKVQQSFKNMSPTDVAGSLIGKLGADKPLSIGSAARGSVGNKDMPFNINGLQIFKAIRLALLRGASQNDASSAYVFFENNKQLVVDTLQNLLNKAMNDWVGPYFQAPMGRNFLLDVARQQFQILSYREEARTDATATAQAGNQTMNMVDMFSNSFKTLNQSFGGASGAPSSAANIPYNSARPPTFAQNFMGARRFAAGQFDSQALTIRVPGNPALTVGHGFFAELMSPLGDTDIMEPELISGPFLTTEVRHHVDVTQNRMQFTTTARGARGSNPLGAAGGGG